MKQLFWSRNYLGKGGLTLLRAYKYRIYPTKEQQEYFA
ncbi:MAG TPA: hypothetical protein DE117_02975, partial [Fervidobacterium sp.]|nr:hypothetical protein [Fervidobacterium sp.]